MDPRVFRERALAELPRLHRLAARLCADPTDAEDLLQEAMLEGLGKCDSVRDPEAAFGWLCRLMRNLHIDRLRRRRRFVAVVEQLEMDDRAIEPGYDESILHGIDRAALEAALDRVEERYRIPFLLSQSDGFTYEEIAAALDCPIGTVASRVARARRQLLDVLAPQALAKRGGRA